MDNAEEVLQFEKPKECNHTNTDQAQKFHIKKDACVATLIIHDFTTYQTSNQMKPSQGAGWGVSG